MFSLHYCEWPLGKLAEGLMGSTYPALLTSTVEPCDWAQLLKGLHIHKKYKHPFFPTILKNKDNKDDSSVDC